MCFSRTACQKGLSLLQGQLWQSHTVTGSNSIMCPCKCPTQYMLVATQLPILMLMQGDGPAQPRFTPQAGMGMFGLQQVQLFWERSLDTKVGAFGKLNLANNLARS